jgi:hypothetical protein
MTKFSALSFILIMGTVIFSQQPKAVPKKPSIKVDFPSTGHTVIADNTCTIRWSRPGIQKNKVKIALIKPPNTMVQVIANLADNTGKFSWIIPHDLPGGSYKIAIKAGALLNKGGSFTVKVPSLTLYEPHPEETLKIGSIKKIRWHTIHAEGMKVKLEIGYQRPGYGGVYKLVGNIPATQKEYDWVVGKWDNNTLNLWGDSEDISTLKCCITIRKWTEHDKTPFKFLHQGPDFSVER